MQYRVSNSPIKYDKLIFKTSNTFEPRPFIGLPYQWKMQKSVLGIYYQGLDERANEFIKKGLQH